MIEGIKWTIDDDCTLTLEELQEKTEGFCGIRVSKSTISNYIGNFDYTFKRLHVKLSLEILKRYGNRGVTIHYGFCRNVPKDVA